MELILTQRSIPIKQILSAAIFAIISNSYADGLNQTNISSPTESNVSLSESDIKMLKKIAEKEKLAAYSGDVGTAPVDKTVSATGAALEETPAGPQLFLFWTQTLANGFYYEGRIYGKYNMRTQNPAFPDVPASAENNPQGYKGVVKLGYNFHITSNYDITPYLRLEAGHDMSLVYADTNGDYIHSNNYAILPGFKQTFKVTPIFAPYIDIYGGVSQVSLTGNMTQGAAANQVQTASVQQLQLTTEMGTSIKISEHQAIIPYIQFVYTGNDPDSTAAASYNNGGFNISSLTSSQQVYAIKYSYSW